MTSEPTGYVMTSLVMRPVYADEFVRISTYCPVRMPSLSGNAHQRRVKLRAWLRGDT
jgi:hypothetical protein